MRNVKAARYVPAAKNSNVPKVSTIFSKRVGLDLASTHLKNMNRHYSNEADIEMFRTTRLHMVISRSWQIVNGVYAVYYSGQLLGFQGNGIIIQQR